MNKTKSVADYIAKSEFWVAELKLLRAILVQTGLQECIKWGAPCYTHNGKNVVGLGAFKSYFGLWFYQGALLKDANKKLINAQEGKTKALRQWRMTSAQEIKPAIIRRYVKESMANIDEGNEIKPARAKSVAIPDELRDALRNNSKFNAAFNNLTPGKKRDYAQYISEASRASTKLRRIEKSVPMIMKGQGLNDRYR